MFSFDIKSGYHHIEIFPDDQQFLGFSWTDHGVVKYFKFTVLPFGLATGPYIFTKLMRPLVKCWRASACKIVVYLDDGMGASHSFSSCVHQANRVKSDIINSGLVPNDEKSMWCPNQQLTWLGLDWNLQFQTLSIPQKKIVKLLTSINDVLASRKIKARQLASVMGLINSTSIVFGSICKLMTKALHRRINCVLTWDSVLTLDSDWIKELQFWLRSVKNLNCRSIVLKPNLCRKVVYSDAAFICAAFISIESTPIFYKNWDAIEMKQSSTWRELLCVRDALRSFIPILHSNKVKWLTDNQAVVSIVNSGSMKVHLHKLALDIFYTLKDSNIEMEIEWIPRTLNKRADYLSRIIDPDDWRVKDNYFQLLQARWGVCTVDCFASCQNFKIKRFYSKYFNPNSLGVDCFSFNWSGEFF